MKLIRSFLLLLALSAGLWSASANVNDPQVADHLARVLAGGGTLSASSQAAEARFCQKIREAGFFAKLHRVNLFCGNFAALPYPLINTWGDAADTLNNYVTGDYTEVGTFTKGAGLNNSTGNTTKYIHTGYNPSTAGCTYQDVHLSVDVLDDTATSANGNSSRFMGSDDAGGSGGAPIMNLYGAQQTGFATVAAPNGISAALILAGFYAFSSQGGNYHIFDGLSQQVRSSSSTPGNVGTLNYNIDVNSCGSAHKVASSRLGAYTMGAGLTDAQVYILGQAVDDFQRDLQRIDIRPTCLSFGDSITRGFGLTAASQRWSFKVAVANGLKEVCWAQDYRRLRADFPTVPFTRGGIQSYTEIGTYTKPVRPERIYIMLGTNDCYDDPDNTNGTPATASDFETKLETILQAFITNGTPAANIVVGSPPVGSDAKLSSATKMGLYVTACSTAAAAKSCKFADIWTATNAQGAGTALQGDGIHLSVAGHITAANTFIAAQ